MDRLQTDKNSELTAHEKVALVSHHRAGRLLRVIGSKIAFSDLKERPPYSTLDWESVEAVGGPRHRAKPQNVPLSHDLHFYLDESTTVLSKDFAFPAHAASYHSRLKEELKQDFEDYTDWAGVARIDSVGAADELLCSHFHTSTSRLPPWTRT
ncbi:MAG: hypothetical protein KVP17_001527 [Porospora cf. gigantea B]|uniref:uncharacterized protein n=1 Tax=Porospora cf. gigantea B TaxID=2853592 RepID=UPI003571EE72|nr:MAG: hypothetical protein KVP17_001527 [Porospora cf. gigantea B]